MDNQEKKMITATSTNVYCIANSHTSQEIDRLLKELSGCVLVGASSDVHTAANELASEIGRAHV